MGADEQWDSQTARMCSTIAEGSTLVAGDKKRDARPSRSTPGRVARESPSSCRAYNQLTPRGPPALDQSGVRSLKKGAIMTN